MPQLNHKASAYVMDEQTKQRVDVHYHSFSRKRGYVFVVEKVSGKFRQVRMEEILYRHHGK